jgi:exodeoxyribonuclease VII large subunit
MDLDSVTITQKTYSLHEVLLSVQSVLQKAYANRSYWVRCELSRISLHGQSGHCYLELIDKNETSIVAQMKGILWADKYSSVSEKFKAVTNSALTGGMKILIHCSVSFHPLHGLSLIISDIDPSFTLGEMARMCDSALA